MQSRFCEHRVNCCYNFCLFLFVPNAAKPQMRLYSLLQTKMFVHKYYFRGECCEKRFFPDFFTATADTFFSIQISIKFQNSARAITVELRNRAAALELERNATKFGPSLSRSRSAQSLKLLGDTATQVRASLGVSCQH